MSHRPIHIALSELTTARLICQNPECRIVTEIPLDKLVVAAPRCPHCQLDFTPPPPTAQTPAYLTAHNPYAMFARGAVAARAATGQVRVEFVVPHPAD